MSVPSLLDLACNCLADYIEQLNDLQQVPEHVCLALFELVLAKGKLTPKVLQLFLESTHETVLARIKALNIQDLPPVLPDTRNRWLGQHPSWY